MVSVTVDTFTGGSRVETTSVVSSHGTSIRHTTNTVDVSRCSCIPGLWFDSDGPEDLVQLSESGVRKLEIDGCHGSGVCDPGSL